MPDESLFISYSSHDRDRVAAVVDDLRNRGLGVWFDQTRIHPSDDIVRAIDAGLREAKYFIVFASRHYLASEWAQREYSAFFYAATNANERHVIAVVLDDANLPMLLASRRAIRWTSAAAVAAEIAAAIDRLRGAPGEPRTAGGGQLGESPAREVRWDELRHDVMDVLMRELFDRYGDIVSRPGPFVPWPVAIAPGETLTMHVAKAVARNEDLIEDLRMEREKARIAKFMVNELSLRLLSSGLGIMEPAFKLAVETNQEKLDTARGVMREQLAAIVPRIVVSG